MSSIFFCGNFCNAEDKKEMEIDVRKNIRSSSLIGRNSRERRIEMGSDNKEYVVDYFLYKVDKDTDSNFSKTQMEINVNKRINQETNFYLTTKTDSTGKPNFRPSRIYQQKSPDQYGHHELEDEERLSRAIDLRASNTTPHLGFENSTYLNNHSPLLTDSSHNLVEQTFGEFNKNTFSTKYQPKFKKYIYYSHISAWKEKRRQIKKLQKIKKVNKDKSHDTSYTISEIHSFSTLGIPGNSQQIEKNEKVIKNFSQDNLTSSEIFVKNETPASTPHFEIQNFNNIQIHSKKCQPVILTGESASILLQSERDVSDTKEKNKSSFSSHSNKTMNNNNGNIITNLKNDLNYNPIHTRMNQNNQRYSNHTFNNTLANESAVEIINMHINNSTSNLNVSLNSKNAFVESVNNTKDKINESEVFSIKDNKKLTLIPENTVKYISINSKTENLNNDLNNLKKGLDREGPESNCYSLTDKMSCAHCEEFYKISIMYSVSLKEMKCLYCNNILNSSSMDFYRMKYKHLEENKEKYNSQNSSVLNKSSTTEKNQARPVSLKKESKLYPKLDNPTAWQEFSSQTSNQSLYQKNHEIIDNNLRRLSSGRKDFSKENSQLEFFEIKQNLINYSKKNSQNNVDTIENNTLRTNSVKQDSNYIKQGSLGNNFNNLENLYKKKKFLFDREKRSLKIESTNKEINIIDNIKKAYDSHNISPINNQTQYEQNQDNFYNNENKGNSWKEANIHIQDNHDPSLKDAERMQDYKLKCINDGDKEEFVNESSQAARDNIKNYALMNYSQEDDKKIQDEAYSLIENENKYEEQETKIENRNVKIDIEQYAFNDNNQDILSDSYLISKKDEDYGTIQEFKEKYPGYYYQDIQEKQEVRENENESVVKESYYNFAEEESVVNHDKKHHINQEKEEISSKKDNHRQVEDKEDATNSIIGDKYFNEDKIPNSEKVQSIKISKKKLNFKIDTINLSPEIHIEKFEADQSDINFHPDINNRTNNSKNNQITITLDSPLSNQIDDKFEYDPEQIVLGNNLYEDDEENTSVNKIRHELENKNMPQSKFRKSSEKVVDKSDDEDYNIKHNEIYKEIMGSQFEFEKDDLTISNKNEIQGQYFNPKHNEMSIIYEDVTNMKEDDSSEIMTKRRYPGRIEESRNVEEKSLDNKNNPSEVLQEENQSMDTNYLNQVFSKGDREKIEMENEYEEDREHVNYESNNKQQEISKKLDQNKNQHKEHSTNQNFVLQKQHDEHFSIDCIDKEIYSSPQRYLYLDKQHDDYFTLGNKNEKYLSNRNLVLSPQRENHSRMENQIIILQKIRGASGNIPFENSESENEIEDENNQQIQNLQQNTNYTNSMNNNIELNEHKGENIDILGQSFSNINRESDYEKNIFEIYSENHFNIVNQKGNSDIQKGKSLIINKPNGNDENQEEGILNNYNKDFNLKNSNERNETKQSLSIEKKVEENFNNYYEERLHREVEVGLLNISSEDLNLDNSQGRNKTNQNLIIEKRIEENFNNNHEERLYPKVKGGFLNNKSEDFNFHNYQGRNQTNQILSIEKRIEENFNNYDEERMHRKREGGLFNISSEDFNLHNSRGRNQTNQILSIEKRIEENFNNNDEERINLKREGGSLNNQSEDFYKDNYQESKETNQILSIEKRIEENFNNYDEERMHGKREGGLFNIRSEDFNLHNSRGKNQTNQILSIEKRIEENFYNYDEERMHRKREGGLFNIRSEEFHVDNYRGINKTNQILSIEKRIEENFYNYDEERLNPKIQECLLINKSEEFNLQNSQGRNKTNQILSSEKRIEENFNNNDEERLHPKVKGGLLINQSENFNVHNSIVRKEINKIQSIGKKVEENFNNYDEERLQPKIEGKLLNNQIEEFNLHNSHGRNVTNQIMSIEKRIEENFNNNDEERMHRKREGGVLINHNKDLNLIGKNETNQVLIIEKRIEENFNYKDEERIHPKVKGGLLINQSEQFNVDNSRGRNETMQIFSIQKIIEENFNNNNEEKIQSKIEGGLLNNLSQDFNIHNSQGKNKTMQIFGIQKIIEENFNYKDEERLQSKIEGGLLNNQSEGFNMDNSRVRNKTNQIMSMEKIIEENFNNHDKTSINEKRIKDDFKFESMNYDYTKQSKRNFSTQKTNSILEKDNQDNIHNSNENIKPNNNHGENNIHITNNKTLLENQAGLQTIAMNIKMQRENESENLISPLEMQNVKNPKLSSNKNSQIDNRPMDDFYPDNQKEAQDEQTRQDEIIQCKKFLLQIQQSEYLISENQESDLFSEKDNDDFTRYKKLSRDIQQAGSFHFENEYSTMKLEEITIQDDIKNYFCDFQEEEIEEINHKKETDKYLSDIQQHEKFNNENKNILNEKVNGNLLSKFYEQYVLDIQKGDNFIYENADNKVNENANTFINRNNLLQSQKNNNFTISKDAGKFYINNSKFIENNQNADEKLIQVAKEKKEKNYHEDESETLNSKYQSPSQIPFNKPNFSDGLEITYAVKDLILNEKTYENQNEFNNKTKSSKNFGGDSYSEKMNLKSNSNKKIKLEDKNDLLHNHIDENERGLIEDEEFANNPSKLLDERNKIIPKALSKFSISNEVVHINSNEFKNDELADNKKYKESQSNKDKEKDATLNNRKDANKAINQSRSYLLEEILEVGDGELNHEDEEDFQNKKPFVINMSKTNQNTILKETVVGSSIREHKVQSNSYAFDDIIEEGDAEIDKDQDEDYSPNNPIQIINKSRTNYRLITYKSREEDVHNLSFNHDLEVYENGVASQPKRNDQINLVFHEKKVSLSEQKHILICEVIMDDCPDPVYILPPSEAAHEKMFLDNSNKPSRVNSRKNSKNFKDDELHIIKNSINEIQPDFSNNEVDNNSLVKEKPKDDLRPIRIKKKDGTNLNCLTYGIGGDLVTNSTTLSKNEKDTPNEKKITIKGIKNVNDIIKTGNTKKLSDLGNRAKDVKRESMKEKPNLLNLELKKYTTPSLKSSKTNTESSIISFQEYSFNQYKTLKNSGENKKGIESNDFGHSHKLSENSTTLNSKGIGSGDNKKRIESNDFGHSHKLSENSTTLNSKGDYNISSGKNTMTENSKIETSSIIPSINEAKRKSELTPANKSIKLTTNDLRRSTQKLSNITGMLTSTTNEPLSVTEKRLKMAEILNKAQNDSNRPSDKKVSDKPRNTILGELGKTNPLTEKNDKKMFLNLIAKVRTKNLIIF